MFSTKFIKNILKHTNRVIYAHKLQRNLQAHTRWVSVTDTSKIIAGMAPLEQWKLAWTRSTVISKWWKNDWDTEVYKNCIVVCSGECSWPSNHLWRRYNVIKWLAQFTRVQTTSFLQCKGKTWRANVCYYTEQCKRFNNNSCYRQIIKASTKDLSYSWPYAWHVIIRPSSSPPIQ